jgi:hypothetical protein
VKKKGKPIENRMRSKNKTGKKKGNPIGNRKFIRQTCDVSKTCFETAVNFLKIWKDTVINFEQND